MRDRVFIASDWQVPYQDTAFLKKQLRVIRKWKPTSIIQIGDLLDTPECSQWTKSQHGEYQETLQDSLDLAHNLLSELRKAAPQAEIKIVKGNHDERFESYIARYAPALRSLRSSSLAYQLGLDRLGISLERGPIVVAPGVLAVHGHERSYSSVAGKYEMDRIKQYGMSVVSGHTHTPVLVTTAQGFGLDQKHFFGMNVGHSMDVKQVWYAKDGHLNWQQAFGMLEVHDDATYPRLITAPAGNFSWQGTEY